MSATRKSATPEVAGPGWMTKAQAAAYVGYSPAIIQRAINDADAPVPLPAQKVSMRGDVRIKRADLDAWIEARAAWVAQQEAAS